MPSSAWQHAGVRALLLLAAAVALADASIVTLALPRIIDELDASVEGAAAVLGVYTLVLTLLLALAARLPARVSAAAGVSSLPPHLSAPVWPDLRTRCSCSAHCRQVGRPGCWPGRLSGRRSRFWPPCLERGGGLRLRRRRMGVALPALAREDTASQAATLLAARHAGITIALALLAPVVADRVGCRHGYSREELALADTDARERYEREHRVDPRDVGGLVRAVLGL